MADPTAGGAPTPAPNPSASSTSTRPTAPLMGIVEEVYAGSNLFNFKLGGKPKADWSGIELPNETKENNFRFRPVNVTKDKYIEVRKKALKSTFAANSSTVTPLLELEERAKAIGLDTYLYLPNPSDKTEMLLITKHYPVFIANITETTKIAQDIRSKFDNNDKREDATLHSVIKASCSKDILDRLQYSMKDNDTAALFLLKVMERAVHSSSGYYDKVRDQLKSLQPRQFTGENIEAMCLKGMELIEILKGANRLSPDDFLRFVKNFAIISMTTGQYVHEIECLISTLSKAIREKVHLPQDKVWEQLVAQNLDPITLIESITTFYRTEISDGSWAAAKLPSSSRTPTSKFSANLASSSPSSSSDVQDTREGAITKLLALLHLDSSPMEKGIARGQSSNGNQGSKPVGASGNCHICGSPDHWARECPKKKTGTIVSRKGKYHNGNNLGSNNSRSNKQKSWRTTAPTSGSPQTIHKNGRTFHWCAKCRRWSSTHGTAGHTGRSNTTTNNNDKDSANLLSVDPGAWCTFIDPPSPQSTNLFTLFSIALLGAISVGLVSTLASMYWSVITSWISHTPYMIATMVMSHVKENLYTIYLPALAPASWFLIGFSTALAFRHSHPPTPMKRSIRRLYQKAYRRWKRKGNRYSKSHHGNFHRSYPRRLKNQNIYHTKAPTHHQRQLQSSLHDFVTHHSRPCNRCTKNGAFISAHSGTCGFRKPTPYEARRLHNKINRGWKGNYYVSNPRRVPHRLTKSQVNAINNIVTSVNLLTLPNLTQHESNIPLVLRAAHQAPGRFRTALGQNDSFPIIWDSGASVSITPDIKDFTSFKSSNVSKLNGVGSGLKVEGEGIVTWTLPDDNGTFRTLHIKAYYAPASRVRLLSTHGLLQEHKGESIKILPHALKLSGVSGNPSKRPVTVRMNSHSNLPMSIAYRKPEASVPSALLSTISSVHDANMNLSEPQKELLRWHYRLGHVDIKRIQYVMRTGVLATSPAKRRLHIQASKLRPTPKCAACQFGKQVRRTTPGTRTTNVPAGKISNNILFPGQEVSVDHFVCSTKGRLWSSRGQTREQDLYHGGAIFVDQASKYIHVENQVSLSTHATLFAKASFEKMCADSGVVVHQYISDGGTSFTSRDFAQHLSIFRQIIRFAGAGAHHHNPAEREIRTIMSIARTMMLHASIHWPELSEPELWPMAVAYAVYTWNHLPNPETGVSPAEIFTKSKWSHHNFQNFHVWGCPVYVLDKEISDGKKIPKWKPRSQRMMFVGFSPNHASSVPMVLNPMTGTITPQFHIVFDDWFDTVSSTSDDLPDYHSPEWYKLFGNSEYQYILDNDDDNIDADSPPTNADFHHHNRFSTNRDRTASAMPPPQPLGTLPPPSVPTNPPTAHPHPTAPPMPPATLTDIKPPSLTLPHDASVERENNAWARPVGLLPDSQPLPSTLPRPLFTPRRRQPSSVSQREQPIAQREQSVFQREQFITQDELSQPVGQPSSAPVGQPSSASVPDPVPISVPPPSPTPEPRPSPPRPRRSNRSKKSPDIYTPSAFVVGLPQHIIEPSINFSGTDFDMPPEYYDDYSDSTNSNHTEDFETFPNFLPSTFPSAYASNRQDPDIYSYDDVLGMSDRLEWYKSAKVEIEALEKYETWTEDLKSNVPEGTKIIPGTWVFKLKRAPDGTPKKHKARFCVRGDLQDISQDETYAPLVSFPTVRLFLALTVLFDWVTLSVDFDNAFVQAILEKPVWIHFPRGFSSASGNTHSKCLRLNRSLYGMATAPRLFYEHLFKVLVKKLQFKQCELDPCLLFRHDIMMIVYCDDVVFAARNREIIDAVINNIRNAGLELTVEGTFQDYLSVNYTKSTDGSVIMTQKGLIEKVLKAANMLTCSTSTTPANIDPLPSDPDGEPMKESWNYRSIIGMLIYLSTNTRPDITFAVSQVARYGNNPKQSHAKAVKKILRYLRSTSDHGITFKPQNRSFFQIDLFVDADFAGRNRADPQSERNSARSRTGYIIRLNGCPLIWKSALQTSISTSTGESEYCALSEGLRQAIPVRNILSMMREVVTLPPEFSGEVGAVRAWEDNSAALSLAINHRFTPRNRFYNVKYHFFWSQVDDGTVVIKKVDTSMQLADYLTKGLSKEMFRACRKLNQGW